MRLVGVDLVDHVELVSRLEFQRGLLACRATVSRSHYFIHLAELGRFIADGHRVHVQDAFERFTRRRRWGSR